MKNTLKVKRLHKNAIIPQYQTAGAACFDLHAATVEGHESAGFILDENKPLTCGTGLAFEVPEGHVMLVFSRSGHGFKHQVRLCNSVGVVDSDYRGEVMVQFICDANKGDLKYVPMAVKPKDRIAQAMIIRVQQWEILESDELLSTDRGTNGLGSTGV